MTITPKTLGISIFVVISLLAIFAVIVMLGPDPGASARAKYASDNPAKPMPTATPSVKLELEGMPSLGVMPPNPEPGADYTTRPVQPEVIAKVSPTPTRPEPTGIESLPPPPPVPDQILRGGLQGDAPAAATTVITPRVEIAQSRYLFNNMDPAALAVSPVVAQQTGGGVEYQSKHFAPETEKIELALLDNVISTDTEIPVVAGVWFPFYFQGRKLLDVGDKIVGTASAGKKRDRLLVTFNKVIKKNGKSFPIKAIARNTDGSVGIPGKVVGNIMLSAIAPVLLESAASFMDTFKERVLVGSGGTQAGFETASGGIQDTPTAGNAGISAGQGALNKVSALLAQDIEENKPYLVIVAGTRLQAFLTGPFDNSDPEYGK